MILLTIGHSAHPIEKLVALLQQHGVHTLVDVRSVPASRFHPQYIKRSLERSMADAQIGYLFLGRELGGRPTDPSVYPLLPLPGSQPGRPDYELMMQKGWFTEGIQHLLQVASRDLAAVMCSEEDPLHCHRHLLIAEYLRRYQPGVSVWHIRGDGTLVSAEALSQSRQGC